MHKGHLASEISMFLDHKSRPRIVKRIKLQNQFKIVITEVDYDPHVWVILCIKSYCSLIYVYGCVFWFEASEISQFIHHKNYDIGNVNYNVGIFALCLNYNYARHPVILQIALNMCKILDFGNGFGIDQKQVTL